jgi:hypothetical protein
MKITLANCERISGPFLDSAWISDYRRVNDLLRKYGAKVDIDPFINGPEGADGSTLLPRQMYNQINNFKAPTTWREPPNYIYVFTALQEIIKKAQHDRIEFLLFVESDCDILEGFEEVLERGSQSLPDDFEMLYLGSNHTWHKTEQISPNLLKVAGSYTTHGLIIRNTAFDTILNYDYTLGTDVQHSKIHARGKSYSLWPNLCVQRPGRSHLNNNFANYLHYFQSKGPNWPDDSRYDYSKTWEEQKHKYS